MCIIISIVATISQILGKSSTTTLHRVGSVSCSCLCNAQQLVFPWMGDWLPFCLHYTDYGNIRCHDDDCGYMQANHNWMNMEGYSSKSLLHDVQWVFPGVAIHKARSRFLTYLLPVSSLQHQSEKKKTYQLSIALSPFNLSLLLCGFVPPAKSANFGHQKSAIPVF